MVSARPIIFRVCVLLRKKFASNKKAPRDKWGLLAAPFLAKGHGVCRRGRFPDSRLSARRLLLARLRRNLGAARSATSCGTVLPGLLCANRASRASGRL